MKLKHHILFLFFMGTILVSCKNHTVQLPFFNSAEFKPEWISPGANEFSEIHTIGDFSFLDQEGRTITNNDFLDKIYVADFFFTTCPGICPEMTSHMKRLQDRFIDNDNIKLLSHSVTPWLDTVNQLKKYADLYEVDSNKWHLVTGTTEAIYSLARTSYFAEREIGLQLTEDDFLHTENFLLIDKKRRIRGIYNGTIVQDIERLEEDIKILLLEK